MVKGMLWGVIGGCLCLINLDGVDQSILWAKHICRPAPHCMSGALHKEATKYYRRPNSGELFLRLA